MLRNSTILHGFQRNHGSRVTAEVNIGVCPFLWCQDTIHKLPADTVPISSYSTCHNLHNSNPDTT